VIRPFVQALTSAGAPERSYVIWSRTGSGQLGAASAVEESADDDARDSTSFLGRRVLLQDHLQGVGSWAAGLAKNLGFPEAVRTDLRAAGELHDLGKLDPRFQLMLQGDEVEAATLASTPLAKSGTGNEDWRARRLAQRSSGYPAGRRHELLSIALMAQASPSTSALADPELVAYLVGTHHGGGRSRFAPQPDPDGRSICTELASRTITGETDHHLDRLDSGVSERFWKVLRDWGWFQLAWLEAVLRLADHGRSAQEQAGPDIGNSQP
jgi:CRISPR-associated endonuclease/helicase Cas3